MNDSQTSTPGNPPPAHPRLPFAAGAALVLIVALVGWAASPLSPFAGNATPTATVVAILPTVSRTIEPASPTAVALLLTATPLAASPTAGPLATVRAQLPDGAATFTPEPGLVIAGPHVLGLTAGVGMRAGDISGAAPLAVTFSEPMDQQSAQAAFSLNPAAPGSYAWQGDTLLFTPAQPLRASTVYTVNVAAAARTVGGKVLAAPLVARFLTAAPPTILRTLPSAGTKEVPINVLVSLSFSRPMIPLTALDNQPDASQWLTISPAVAGRWVWLGTAAVGFRADSGFAPATDYVISVKAGWPDYSGVPLAQASSFSFSTIRPAITSFAPQGYTVPLDGVISVSFNQPMDRPSVEQAFTLQGEQRVAGRFAWNDEGSSFVFTPTNLLKFSQGYRASFGAVKAATGTSVQLEQPTAGFSFFSTTATRVSAHYPSNDNGQPQPSDSFSFTFNNPLKPSQDVSSYLTVEPKPEGYLGRLEIDSAGTTVYSSGLRLLADTTYRFSLKAGLKDKWGFDVASAEWQVQIGPLPASLEVKGGQWQPLLADNPARLRVDAVNLDKVQLELYQFSEADLREALQPTRDYQPTPVYPGTLKRTWTAAVTKSVSKASINYLPLSLDGQGDRLPVGYYFVRASAANPYASQHPLQGAAVLVVGRTGLVTKREGRDLLVWAVDLANGKPKANYALRVEQWPFKLAAVSQSVTTGADGTVRLKLAAAAEGSILVVIGAQQGDVAFVSSNRNAGLNASYASGSSQQRSAAYTDRPIYRPSQVVYYRAVFRADDDASYSLPLAAKLATVRVTARTNNGERVIYTGTTSISQLGTTNGQFSLPSDAPVGSYSLDVNTGSDGIFDTNASFSVQEYRKPDFKVDVSAKESSIKGDPITATVQTSYYFGGPLSNVTTTINLQTSPYYFAWSDPISGESYSFGEQPPYYSYYATDRYGRPQPGEQPQTSSFQTRSDKAGYATVDVSQYVSTTAGSQSVLIEGQVQDLSNQTVAANTTTIVHQGQFYVGLRAEYIATAKQPTTITVRTVNADGSLHPNASVKLTFIRREWVAPTYGSNEQYRLVENEAGTATVSSDAQGRASYYFTAQQAGDYSVQAESRDTRGNTIHTRVQLWVASSGYDYIPWRFDSENAVKLVADKPQYNVGDTARILITSPYTQATALLTIERGHLKRYRVISLQGGAPTIEVPLEDGDLPNVYLNLTIIGVAAPAVGSPQDRRQASLRSGYLNLSLNTAPRKLTVSLEPQGQSPYLPGSTVSVTLRTKDSAGRPVQGDFALAVVDEAIYALQADNATNLFATYWAERGVSVQTGSSFGLEGGYVNEMYSGYRTMLDGGSSLPRDRVASSAAPTTANAGVIEQKAAQPSAPQKVRTDFRDTAYWRGSVTTGADGTATIAIPFPDNLTTWRLTTQGIDANTRAGAGSTVVTVTQPLLLRPVHPRFLTTGDSPRPQAIIHNYTGGPLTLEASLVTSGALTITGPTSQTVTVAAGEEQLVGWLGTVGKGDTAGLRYWVHTSSGNYYEDAVEMSLPVKPFAAPEAVATSGEVNGSADEAIFLPYSLNPLLGELVVQVSPSLAAATADGVRYLEIYPYECSEQTTSRFLPLVVLEKAYREQGRTTPFSKELPTILDKSFKRLADLQQGDGGWDWWERGPSSWWNTAYVVQGLVAARDAGYNVPASMLQRGIERLQRFSKEQSNRDYDEVYNLNMRAYTVYVLAQATQQSGSLSSEATLLVQQSARMSNHARAWLAMALQRLGQPVAAKQVLDTLLASARQSSTTAHWEEDAVDYWSMATDNRATALALDALIAVSPSDPLVPKTVRWLMTAQRDGHWLTTIETSISLIALAHYIAESKELLADYSWNVTAFDQPLGNGVANSSNLTQTTTLRLPVSGMPQNTLGNLKFNRQGDKGKMYYQVSLRYYVPGEGIKARSEGLAINRSYYQMTNGVESSSPITSTNAGDLVKVRLIIVAPETSYYLLVTDPLPAGLEGVNGTLNTTSFTERSQNPSGQQVADPAGMPTEDYGYGWRWWRWGPFDNVEMRDDRTVLFASYLSPGTYVYEYYARATTPGQYMNLPAHVELLYYPDVFGHSDGGQFTVR